MDESIRLLENKRQEVKRSLLYFNIYRIVIVISVCAFIFIILLFVPSIYLNLVSFIFFLIIVISSIPKYNVDLSLIKQVSEFDKELRESIVNSYIYERYGGPEYISQNRFNLNEIKNYHVILRTLFGNPVITPRRLAFYNSEDYIRGTYKGVPYEQSSVQMHIKYTYSWKNPYGYYKWSLRRLKPRYPFNGRVLLFTSPRLQNINSVSITTKTFPHSVFTSFDGKQVIINDLFNRDFFIYASNPQDAYNLLTPQLMAEIANIKNYFSDFTICINQGIVSVAINNLDSPFDRAYEAPLDRHQIYQLTDEYMNVTSKMLDTFFAVLL